MLQNINVLDIRHSDECGYYIKCHNCGKKITGRTRSEALKEGWKMFYWDTKSRKVYCKECATALEYIYA